MWKQFLKIYLIKLLLFYDNCHIVHWVIMSIMSHACPLCSGGHINKRIQRYRAQLCDIWIFIDKIESYQETHINPRFDIGHWSNIGWYWAGTIQNGMVALILI